MYKILLLVLLLTSITLAGFTSIVERHTPYVSTDDWHISYEPIDIRWLDEELK